ncbi:unnamed protein product [Clonostachys byssicola]|uniref:Uncharacterized protein n=1 Tax=Clonostachys byssicola TaxID=160290 RepID=A0A9N9UI83_9HYPO|nr:unnamed protein product [Clonostachys byssicola]
MAAAPIIWINAFPGTGKLTVAEALATLIPKSVVIDNHQLIDLVKLSRDHPCYQIERKKEREKAFNKYLSSPGWAEHTIIFTDFQTTNQLGESVAREYQAAAKAAKRPFIPVYLTCDCEVNITRATSYERLQGGTTKLTDPTMIRDFRSRCSIFQFEAEDHQSCLIDTTSLAPADAASKIMEYCQSLGTSAL